MDLNSTSKVDDDAEFVGVYSQIGSRTYWRTA